MVRLELCQAAAAAVDVDGEENIFVDHSSFVLIVTGDDDDKEDRWLLLHNAYVATDVPRSGAEPNDASYNDVIDEQALPQACVHSPCVSSEGHSHL